MKRCWFHTWKKINGTMHGTFMGEPTSWEYDEFRICKKCGVVQSFSDDSNGGYWGFLSDQDTEIFKRKKKMNCAICKREGDDLYFEEHHLTPKSRKGRETILVCKSCGDAIHQFCTVKELEKKYNTLEKLLTHEKIQNWIVWISKKPIESNVCMKRKK